MASLREKIHANVQPFLKPGEQVQGVLPGQNTSQYWLFAGVIVFLIMNRYRTIVATDQRIIVFDSGRWGQTKCNSVVVELPRTTKLGPTSGAIWHKVDLGAETIRIHRRFFGDVRQIDGG